jgi:streptogramin lyase
MPRIAISYRRDDSAEVTGRIFDRLAAHYGVGSVFRDIDNIPLGVDFREHISTVLAQTDITLVVVGKRWSGPQPRRRRRIDDPADPVRVEVETALHNGMPVVPVLVEGGAMPNVDQLPDSLKELVYRNGLEVDSGRDFDQHIERLIRNMEPILSRRAETARLAEEEKQRAEAARLAVEERQRAEAAQKAAEERQRVEAAQKAAEERQRAEAAQKAEEETQRAEAAQKAEEEKRRTEAARQGVDRIRQTEATRRTGNEKQRFEWTQRKKILTAITGFFSIIGLVGYSYYHTEYSPIYVQPGWRTYTEATTNGGLPNDSIWRLALGAEGSLWIATRTRGLARLDKNGRWRTWVSPIGLPDNTVRALALGADDVLWVGTEKGLARLGKDGQWGKYSQTSTWDLPDNRVSALAIGSDGAVWVGTSSGGLARLDKDQWRTYSRDGNSGGLPGLYVLALGADGMLWAGTNEGLARVDKDGQLRTYTEATTNGGLPEDCIDALLALGAEGSLWVGTCRKGLARLDKSGQWRTYSKVGTKGGLPDDRVRALALGLDGALWVGTDGGLVRLEKDGW